MSGPLKKRDLPRTPAALAPPQKPTALFISGHISPDKLPDKRHRVLILLDSGATVSAISRKTIEKYKLRQTPLPFAIHATNADGSPNTSGPITHACTLQLTIGTITHQWTFRVTTLYDTDIYVGFDWLYHYNPPIDWRKLSLSIPDKEFLNRLHSLPALPEGIPECYAEYVEVFSQEVLIGFLPNVRGTMPSNLSTMPQSRLPPKSTLYPQKR